MLTTEYQLILSCGTHSRPYRDNCAVILQTRTLSPS